MWPTLLSTDVALGWLLRTGSCCSGCPKGFFAGGGNQREALTTSRSSGSKWSLCEPVWETLPDQAFLTLRQRACTSFPLLLRLGQFTPPPR